MIIKDKKINRNMRTKAWGGPMWFTLFIIASGLTGRVIGAMISMYPSRFTLKDKLFVGASFLPKGTATAVTLSIIAGVLGAGHEMVAIIGLVASIAILLTIPLAEFLIPKFEDKLIFLPDDPRDGQKRKNNSTKTTPVA